MFMDCSGLAVAARRQGAITRFRYQRKERWLSGIGVSNTVHRMKVPVVHEWGWGDVLVQDGSAKRALSPGSEMKETTVSRT